MTAATRIPRHPRRQTANETPAGQTSPCEPDESPLHPERVYQAFKRRVRKHGLPDLSPHGLRHTWATIALANGVRPRVVQERLGHAHISVTLQTYSHVQPTMHDDAAALVAGLILPAD